MRTTIAAVGALCALAACTVERTDAVAVPVTKPTDTTIADMDVDEDVLVGEIALELTWSTLPASDRTTMCDGYRTLTEDQFRRMAEAYAPEIDADAFIALLDKEC